MTVFLTTDRLTLRRFTPDDADHLIALDSDPEVMRYLSGGVPTPPEVIREQTLPRLLAFYERGDSFGYWAALDPDGRFIGWFLLRPPTGPGPHGEAREGIELGYRLLRSAWGRGYATEGSRALIRKAFTELGVERVFAETMWVNTGSRRVMEKAGLRHVASFHRDWPESIPGSEHGEVEYASTKAQWQATPG